MLTDKQYYASLQKALKYRDTLGTWIPGLLRSDWEYTTILRLVSDTIMPSEHRVFIDHVQRVRQTIHNLRGTLRAGGPDDRTTPERLADQHIQILNGYLSEHCRTRFITGRPRYIVRYSGRTSSATINLLKRPLRLRESDHCAFVEYKVVHNADDGSPIYKGKLLHRSGRVDYTGCYWVCPETNKLIRAGFPKKAAKARQEACAELLAKKLAEV